MEQKQHPKKNFLRQKRNFAFISKQVGIKLSTVIQTNLTVCGHMLDLAISVAKNRNTNYY